MVMVLSSLFRAATILCATGLCPTCQCSPPVARLLRTNKATTGLYLGLSHVVGLICLHSQWASTAHLLRYSRGSSFAGRGNSYVSVAARSPLGTQEFQIYLDSPLAGIYSQYDNDSLPSGVNMSILYHASVC